MRHLKEIALRHARDRWLDILFIGGALLLTAISIGATTSQAVGDPVEHIWSVQMTDTPASELPAE
jgi:hypothetical protein